MNFTTSFLSVLLISNILTFINEDEVKKIKNAEYISIANKAIDFETIKSNLTGASNSDIRKSYNKAMDSLFEYYKPIFQEIHSNNQQFNKNLAEEVSTMRELIKEAHQKQTSYLGNIGISIYNVWNYGSINNPDINYFLSKGKSLEEIVYSSFKTNGADLGLDGNGFNEKIALWKDSIKQGVEIYPEYISDNILNRHQDNDNYDQYDQPMNENNTLIPYDTYEGFKLEQSFNFHSSVTMICAA